MADVVDVQEAGSILNVFAVNDGADVFLIAQFQNGTTVQIDPM